MAMSGIKIDDSVKDEFSEMNSGNKKNKLMIMKLSDDKTKVVIDKLKTADEYSFEAFVEELPDDECCYAVAEFHGVGTDTKRDVLTLIQWNPDNASAKSKMVYAATVTSVKAICKVISIQANDKSDLTYDEVNKKHNLK